MAKNNTGTQLAFETSIKVDIERIKPNPYQPKGRLVPPEEIVEKVANSIEAYGLLQTPVVRQCADGTYEMGDGWIRLNAYKKLSIELGSHWRFMPVVIRELSDRHMADMILEANTVRHDLSPIDLGQLYRDYLQTFKISQGDLARVHHISQGELANTIRLLELPEEVQQMIISRKITATHGLRLLQLSTPKEISEFADKSVLYDMNVATLDSMIKEYLAKKKEDVAEAKVQTCRVCGCTEEHACEGGCSWVEEDLCSACQAKEKAGGLKKEEAEPVIQHGGKQSPAKVDEKTKQKPNPSTKPAPAKPAAAAASPPPVKTNWGRKLVIEEKKDHVLMSCMKAGDYPVFKKVEGVTLDQAMGVATGWLADLAAEWAAKETK